LALVFFGIDLFQFALSLGGIVAIYIPLAISLNLELGYAGIPNFGKAFLFAVGASLSGAVMARVAIWLVGIKGDFLQNTFGMIAQVDEALSKNVPLALGILVLAIILAALFGSILGFVASYPAIRLREDYLAMTLLAMAEFYVIFMRNYTPLISGAIGIPPPDPFAWAGDSRFIVATGVMLAFALLVYLYAERVVRSPLGRTLRAIRDNENASEALGKDTVAFRRKVLIVASAISGVAGALWGFYTLYISPDTYTRLQWTIIPWVMVIMGGAANNVGVAVGVVVYELAFKLIDYSKNAFEAYLPFDVNWLQYLIVGIVLTAVLIYRPDGILKEKPSATIARAKLDGLMAKHSPPPQANEGPP
jgi:branched-chain amino acid transport system permease protein